PMTPRLVEAHPRIESTHGSVAIERGPIVYCVEQADHPRTAMADVTIDATTPLESTSEADLLGGVVVVRANGWLVATSAWRHRLYRPRGTAPRATRRPVTVTAIPYYTWANRDAGAMRVWIPCAEERP